MPVNYATPDPGIIDRPYVQQVPLEALFKNLAYKQAKYDQGLQQAKQSLQAAGNIAAYGQDEAARDEMFKKLNTDLQQFNSMDLGDSRVTGQLDSLIANFHASNDVAGIDARGRTYAKMQKEEEAAQSKGLEYYNPGLDAARKYYAKGEYKPSARFLDSGNIAPDMEKINTEILKNPNVSYKKKEVVNGRIVETTVVDKDKAAEEYRLRADTDPRLSKYMEYKFNSMHDGVDWKVEGTKHFQDRAQAAQDLGYQYQRAIALEQAKGAKANPAWLATYQAGLEEQRQKVSRYSNLARDPHLLGTDFKAKMFDEFKSEEAQRYGDSKELHTVSDIDADQMSLEGLKHQNNMVEESLKHTHELESEVAKNTLERGYAYDAKTKTDGSPLVYNPDTPSKSGKGLTKMEELHYGEVLRKKYKTLTPEDVKSLFPINSPMGILVAQDDATVEKKTGLDGTDVYELTAGGKKFQLMSEDQFVKMNIKGSKEVMAQMEADIKKDLTTTPGDSTHAVGSFDNVGLNK